MRVVLLLVEGALSAVMEACELPGWEPVEGAGAPSVGAGLLVFPSEGWGGSFGVIGTAARGGGRSAAGPARMGTAT